MTVTVVRYSEQPELWDSIEDLSSRVWPEYNMHGDVVNQWPDTATLTPAWEQRAPLGRMCKPSDVCALLTALLSDDLEFMTGSTVVLDGGHSVRL